MEFRSVLFRSGISAARFYGPLQPFEGCRSVRLDAQPFQIDNGEVAVSIAVASGCSPLEIVDGRGGILVHAKAVEVEDTQGVQPLPMAGKGRPLCEVHGFGEVALDADAVRSEERRVGKGCVSTCRSRWAPYH